MLWRSPCLRGLSISVMQESVCISAPKEWVLQIQGGVEMWDDKKHPVLLQMGCKSEGLLVPVEMLMEKILL